MDGANPEPSPEPRIELEARNCRPTGGPSHWTCSWIVRNLADSPAKILSTWLPHDQFFGESREHRPPLDLPPLGTIGLEAVVRCSQPPGAVIENAFVILRIDYLGRGWRVFARQQVRVDNQGAPRAICKSVTCQPVADPNSAG